MLDYIRSVACDPRGRPEITTKAGMSLRISDIPIDLCRAITKTTGWVWRESSIGGLQGLPRGLVAFASRTLESE